MTRRSLQGCHGKDYGKGSGKELLVDKRDESVWKYVLGEPLKLRWHQQFIKEINKEP